MQSLPERTIARIRLRVCALTSLLSLLVTLCFYIPASHASGTPCPQLPAGFDPLQASASEIHAYLLPPRPSDPTLVADWTNEIKHIKRLQCTTHATSSNVSGIGHRIKTSKGSAKAGQDSTYTWSGYDVNTDTFDDLKGNWTTPYPPGTNQGPNAELATWIGLGGEFGNLFQTGTIYTAKDALYHPFWEAPSTNNPWKSPQIDYSTGGRWGSSIQAEVYKYGSEWCFWLDFGGFADSSCLSSYNPDQSSGEWIDERPICSSTVFAHLLNFGSVSFSNTYAHSTSHNWHTLLGFSHDNNVMYDSWNGNTLASPDSPSSGTTFTDRWQNHQDADGNANCAI